MAARNKYINERASQDTIDKLTELAKSDDRSRGNWLEVIINREYKKLKESESDKNMDKIYKLFGSQLDLDVRGLSRNDLIELGFKLDCESTDTDTPAHSLDFYYTIDGIDNKLMQTIGYSDEEWDEMIDDDGVIYDEDMGNRKGYCRFI